jgi:hypothetical protein
VNIKIAQIAKESPESQKLIFSCSRRATKEAPSWAWKNSFCDEDLKWIAGNSFKLKTILNKKIFLMEDLNSNCESETCSD